jgi:diguanylate cyclase (GGDEF)-like protein/PAS domain S-box-containing protein
MKEKFEKPVDAADLRRQAETKLSERKKREAAPPATESDTWRLVHELEVHQIELEMQNEELQRLQEKLEESRAKYFDLYDLAPVAYLTLSAQGLILEGNLTVAKLLGIEKSQLLSKPATRFIVREDQAIFHSHLQRLFETCVPQVCELRMIGKGSVTFWVQLDANLVIDAGTGPSLCRVALSDITTLKQVEETLKHLGTHDALTGLYSRGFFVEEMERFERGRSFPVSIVVADIDDLKKTNDQHGHAAGDALLKSIAQLLTATFRAEDVIARIGGDEFAVLLPTTDATSGIGLLKRLRGAIRTYNTAHPETPIQLSLGISTAEDRAPLLAVLEEADANMYREKRGHDADEDITARKRSEVAELRHESETDLNKRKK